MEKLRSVHAVRRTPYLGIVGAFALTITAAFVVLNATPGIAQAQTQTPAVAAPVYEYEVVSIKPNKSGGMMPGGTPLDDGINVSNIPLQYMIYGAFGVGPDRVTGLPGWVSSDRFDISAKMETSVADAMKKLSVDDRKTAQQHMLLSIFMERCGLKYHRETKEMQTYTLTLGKNGPKFKEAKPGEAPA